MAGDLHHLSALEALALFRSRELSPVELLDALVARADACDGTINAICDRRLTEARAEAAAAADRYAAAAAGRGDRPGPLDGIPVAAKEEQPMAGRSATYGSLAYAGATAEVTHPFLERIQDAGGVIHLRTTTPEFCCAGFTHSRLWGVTRNPWNPDWSPGGSSGGSGAALAAGYAPLATGSDIAGSIRIPASFCGVVGYKAPHGRIPALPPFNLDQYCHDGPMSRTVADCALLTMAVAGRHRLDVVSLPGPLDLPLAPGPVNDLRVALCLRLGDHPLDPEVEANTLAAARRFEALGVTVSEVTLPWTMERIHAALDAHWTGIFGPSIALDDEAHPGLLSPYAADFARRYRQMAAAAGPGAFLAGLELEGELYEPLARVLADHDALVCPTLATRGFAAGEDYLNVPLPVGGVDLDHHFKALLTVPFNIASRCPVLSVPSGLAANGVPTGIQIVGRTYDERTPFRLALAYEAAVGGFPPAPWPPAPAAPTGPTAPAAR